MCTGKKRGTEIDKDLEGKTGKYSAHNNLKLAYVDFAGNFSHDGGVYLWA